MIYCNGQYLQINTWAFPYWPGYHPETPILARDAVEVQYGNAHVLNYLLHNDFIQTILLAIMLSPDIP